MIPDADDDYESWLADVEGGIRYEWGGTPAPNPGAREALERLGCGVRPTVDLKGYDLEQLEAAAGAALRRGIDSELPLTEAAHVVLDALRDAGLPVPPRPPDDPFPDL